MNPGRRPIAKGVEPRFDIDLAYGKQAEVAVADLLDSLIRGEQRAEIKRKRRIDFHLYVETHADKGATGAYEPSGLSVTTAAVWVFAVASTGIAFIVPTALLRAAIKDAPPREERDGSCPTQGRLVDLRRIMRAQAALKPRIAPAPSMTTPKLIKSELAAEEITWAPPVVEPRRGEAGAKAFRQLTHAAIDQLAEKEAEIVRLKRSNAALHEVIDAWRRERGETRLPPDREITEADFI